MESCLRSYLEQMEEFVGNSRCIYLQFVIAD